MKTRIPLLASVMVVWLLSLADASAFYDPGLQRWINRDPLGEAGGINLYGFVFNAPSQLVDAFGLEIRPPTGDEAGQISDVISCLASHDVPSLSREALELNSRHYMVDTDLSTKGKKDKSKYTKGWTKPDGPNNNTVYLSPDLFIKDKTDPDFKSYVSLPSQDGKDSFKSSVADAMIHESAHLCNSNPGAPGWMSGDNVHDWIKFYINQLFRTAILNTKKHEIR